MTSPFPRPLSPGDPVSLVAPAGPDDPTSALAGRVRTEAVFTILGQPDSSKRSGFLAGSDEVRIRELQAALDGESRAIIAVRGGWGTSRILDRIELGSLERNPRWIVGSSDLTSLLVHLWTTARLPSIHGPMSSRFDSTDSADVDALFDLLLGSPWTAPAGLRPVIPGSGSGPMIGGNLTVLTHLCGTLDPSALDGTILFLEDVGEPPYRVDRCLVQLERSGLLPGPAGVVLGNFTGSSPEPYDTTVDQVLEEHLARLGVPVAAGYPGAHGGRNYPFVHGGEVLLEVGETVSLLATEGERATR